MSAYNKGIRLPRVSKRINQFDAGLAIECPKHGSHHNWLSFRQANDGYRNIRCRFCQNDQTKDYIKRNYLKVLAAWTKRRDKNSEITEEFLLKLLRSQNGACALTGINFNEENKPSVDRIDSSLGYLKSNVQLVLFEINRMKTNLSLDIFIQRCRQVSGYYSGKTV